ncbi:hypothetical protein [Kitasatospora sp. NPDC085879]|uniref:hypothetical protein n=1 Tax=Kitasatospora sp. NPDC085879 TaxID=3154769 RepID=UPI000BB156EA|nr:hypothetical protein [Streptomyces sp. TLI_235]PBC70683.1 hypothetical protein BX265_5235 [Streptomyces sp. TLI_235]
MSDDAQQRPPDRRHDRPAGMDDATVEALGLLSEALEMTERARGRLYDFHQLTGGADRIVALAVHALRAAGHVECADLVVREVQGRDVLPGMWTYQIVETYNDDYYRTFVEVERRIRESLAPGRDHIAEAEMHERRETR